MNRPLYRSVLISAQAIAVEEIRVMALFTGKAVVGIDGQQHAYQLGSGISAQY